MEDLLVIEEDRRGFLPLWIITSAVCVCRHLRLTLVHSDLQDATVKLSPSSNVRASELWSHYKLPD